MTISYIRGTNDARRFSIVEQTMAGWLAHLSDSGALTWILEPVDRDYLQGLYDGGCKLRCRIDLPKATKMERLRDRLAWFRNC